METVQHGDSWWRHGDDGTWYRWNETTRSWEYAPPAHQPAAAPRDLGYRAPQPVGRALAALLGAGAVLDVAAAGMYVAELRRWDAALRGSAVAETAGGTGDLRLGLLSVALLTVLLATIPVFIVWFHRLYTNLPSLGATDLRFGRGWAIGAWFVPLLNLWRPKQIADDIWRASDPQLDATAGAQWRGRPVAAVVHLWWVVYLGSNLVNQAVVRFTLTAEGPAELRTQALAETGAAVLDCVAALVTMWLVVRLTARQEQRAALVHPS